VSVPARTAFAIGALVLGCASALGALSPALQEGVEGCASGLGDSEKETKDADAEAEAIRAALEKPAPPNATPVAEATVAAAKQEALQAKELLGAAASLQQQARAKLASVAAASNPAEAQVRLREAQDMVALSRNMTRRARAITAPERGAAGGAGPAALRLTGEGEAMRQLLQANRVGQVPDGSRSARDAKDIVDWNESTGVMTVSGGYQVGTRSLAASFRSVTGSGAPLFQRAEPPSPGAPPAWRLSPQAEAALRDPRKRAELENVGGVELRVTLDLLEFHELAEFRKPGPALIVEQPVLVSLAALAAAARPFEARWEALPEPLRYPGAIERIVGFVLAPAQRDVLLVGVPARRPENRIELDDLVVGLRAVWRDGEVPGVSLDPAPDAPGGAQYPRVIGVPESSRFARIMLDADYAMKRIIMGAQPVGAPGYASLLRLRAAGTAADGKAGRDRFWFFPVPLRAGDLQVSPGARGVLFNAGVQVLTEGQRLAAQGFVGTGAADPTAARAAELFTAALDELERTGEGAPPGVFAALHGLIDIVTLCTVWRGAGVDAAPLGALAALPVRRREGAQALPKFYPGVTSRLELGGGVAYTMSGGVQAKVLATQRSIERLRDRTLRSLEAAADAFPRDGRLAQPVALRMTLPRAGAGGRADQRALGTAEAALAVGDYAQAREIFRRLAAQDPLNADLWARLALAQSQLGEHAAARASMAKARALEPVDEDLRVLALEVALRADPKAALASTDRAARRSLAEDYVMRAAAAMGAGDDAAAGRLAGTAAALDDANPDAYFLRAVALAESARAIPDLQRAVDRYRVRYKAAGADADALRLARALGLLVSLQAQQAVKAGDGGATLEKLLRQLEEVRAHQLFDPGLHAAEVQTRIALEIWLRSRGRKGDSDFMLDQANRLAARHPDYPMAYYLAALAYRVLGRSGDAVGALTGALKRDPTFARAYAERAELYAELGLCGRARADAAEARRWKVRDLGEMEKNLAKCTS
jgi:tetratricopeptide (TPR) repeat protein